ncbi:MAG: anaerobic ribonucleoside-triphosphate reductase, partial [Oscillospiraceae bacterium]
PIFPIQIFRVKEGVNYNPGEPNYDLFQLACRCSAKRLFPNFSFIDAPFNLQYYDPKRPETEIAYMGCRTRVIANIYDPERQICNSRGNLSFTTINLPRLAIKARGSLDAFFESLDHMMDLCVDQLLERFEIQCRKRVRNFPFLMGQGVWLDSENLGWNDEVREVLKHGSLSVGFIGLAETLKALTGEHHGESEKAQRLGLEIIAHMRGRLDEESEKRALNFTLLATPAEGLSGRFVRIDRKKYGVIPGVTDREYYTNSFHIPVYYHISAFQKIKKEAPYHALTNAGHISYVEMDGDPLQNLQAFEKIVRCMKEEGVGYGSINHAVDRDPCCGYTGIIKDQCPKCGRKENEGAMHFERIRRITGYLVGTVERFNDAKRAEEHDRVKHGLNQE